MLLACMARFERKSKSYRCSSLSVRCIPVSEKEAKSKSMMVHCYSVTVYTALDFGYYLLKREL